MIVQKVLKVAFDRLLSVTVKEKTEKTILTIAIISYLIHLFLIVLNTQGVINLEEKFFKNPIAAIYTPFSFILIYEVYLLIFFLSAAFRALSTTTKSFPESDNDSNCSNNS